MIRKIKTAVINYLIENGVPIRHLQMQSASAN